ncbi:MAG: HEAT repeat domain-containing protein [Methanolinea sp.]|nr:HEAT repeat domain-containing protein [Methanolinea sp.]
MTQDPGCSSPEGDDQGAQQALKEQATRSPDSHVRRYSLSILGNEPDPRHKGIFLSALRDPDKETRAQATAALAALGDDVVPSLVVLLSDTDWKVRYRAAEALGEIRSSKSVQALIGALSDEKDHVRYMAAKALGEIGDRGAVPALIGTLGDENPFVRKAAVLSLGKIGDNSGKEAVRVLSKGERIDIVREAIQCVLPEESQGNRRDRPV